MFYAICQTAAAGSNTLQTSVSKNAKLKFGGGSTALEAILGIVMVVGLATILMDGQ